MIDQLFARLQQRKLSDWGVVLLGASGLPGSGERLSSNVIKDFANAALENIPVHHPVLDRVVDLANGDGVSMRNSRETLTAICEAFGVDLGFSKQRWRAVLLEAALANLNPDPIYGMIELSEFWRSWDWPDDAPATMRRNYAVSPEEYQSDKHFERVIEEHRRWLQAENWNFGGLDSPKFSRKS